MGRRRNRERLKASYAVFLDQAQAEDGGFYESRESGRAFEFMRPLRCPYVRVRDMRTQAKTNLHFEELTPLNEMKVLAYMTWTKEDEARTVEQERIAESPATIETPDFDPQEPGDVGFLK